jgi:hypothetical protein
VSYPIDESARRRVIQASSVRIVFSVPAYWFAGQSELKLGAQKTVSADNTKVAIVCMGSMFTVNQTTPAEPQHVIGSFKPIDNPIMAWDGNASLRTLVSEDPRLATLFHQFAGMQENFEGGAQNWEEWAANWKGCSADVYDKLALGSGKTAGRLIGLSNVKVTAENIAVQARAIVARDVQFNHLGNW